MVTSGYLINQEVIYMTQIDKNSCEELDRDVLANLLGLPLRIYGTLTYVGMSAEGEICMYFSKQNQYKLVEYLHKLKAMVGREVYLYIDEGEWEGPSQEE